MGSILEGRDSLPATRGLAQGQCHPLYGRGTGPNSRPGLAKPGVDILTAECCGRPVLGCLPPCSHPVALRGIPPPPPPMKAGEPEIRAGDSRRGRAWASGHGWCIYSTWSRAWDGVSLGTPSQGRKRGGGWGGGCLAPPGVPPAPGRALPSSPFPLRRLSSLSSPLTAFHSQSWS